MEEGTFEVTEVKPIVTHDMLQHAERRISDLEDRLAKLLAHLNEWHGHECEEV